MRRYPRRTNFSSALYPRTRPQANAMPVATKPAVTTKIVVVTK